MRKLFFLFLLLPALTISVIGCERNEGEEAVDATGDALRDAADETGDAMNEAGDNVRDAAN